MGMTRKQAVYMVHLLALLLGLSVLPVLWGDEKIAVVCVIQACILLLLVSFLQFSVMADKSANSTVKPD
jgi:UDP-GlcNAc:undecaprenyl-phosphate GlcNAc-1-phosphate transferase